MYYCFLYLFVNCFYVNYFKYMICIFLLTKWYYFSLALNVLTQNALIFWGNSFYVYYLCGRYFFTISHLLSKKLHVVAFAVLVVSIGGEDTPTSGMREKTVVDLSRMDRNVAYVSYCKRWMKRHSFYKL